MIFKKGEFLMNTGMLKAFDEYLAKNKEEILNCVIELAKIPSVCADGTDDAPFGKECLRALEKAVELMNEAGFSAAVSQDKKYGLATLGEGEKTIGLFAHTDVVPASREDWMYTAPFEPKRLGDVLIGRGVDDNKAGVAISLNATKMLYELGYAPKSRISVFLGSNEESGMQDIEAYVQQNKMPDICLVPDAQFPVSFGEKGICQGDFVFPDKFTDIVDLYGGNAYNIVLDKAVCKIKYSDELYCELCKISETDEKIDVERENDEIKVTGHGLPSHASRPHLGISATSVIAHALCKCNFLCESDRKILQRIYEITSDPYGESLGIACEDEYFGKLTIANGMCAAKDGAAHISFDIRYCTAISANDLSEKLHSAFATIENFNNREGFAIPRDNKVAAALERVYMELSGDNKAQGIYMGGGTYCRHLKNAFSIGTQADYIENDCVQLPEGHGGVHQSDEVLYINRFIEAIKIVAVMIYECDKIISE